MERIHKKIKYSIAILMITALALFIYHFFFSADTITPDHVALSLTPVTKSEQRELIRAQQMQERTATTGPLIALVNPADAQAQVLNRNK